MYSIRNGFSLLFILWGFHIYAQEKIILFYEPDLALNYQVAKGYSHNFEIAQRAYLYQDKFAYRTRHIDVGHFSTVKIAFAQSLALGIQYRFRDNFENAEENELRITQQYNIVRKKGSVRLGNRFRAEQRIQPSLTIHRFRYRFAIDFPLNGEKLDLGESYFSSSVESLLSMSRMSRAQYDQRVTSYLGWLLTPEARIQIGAEYRVENYTRGTENVLFLLTSLVFSL